MPSTRTRASSFRGPGSWHRSSRPKSASRGPSARDEILRVDAVPEETRLAVDDLPNEVFRTLPLFKTRVHHYLDEVSAEATRPDLKSHVDRALIACHDFAQLSAD